MVKLTMDNNITTPFSQNSTVQSTSTLDNDGLTSWAAFLYKADAMVWQILPPLLLVLGCFGNGMTIAVMRAMLKSPPTACIAVYFTALAASDLCLLIDTVAWYWVSQVPQLFIHTLTCTALFFVSYVSSMMSAWVLVAMTFQRVLSVVVPHRVGVLCTVKRGKAIVGCVFALACAANTHILFNYRTVATGSYDTTCQSIDENLANAFLLMDLALSSLVPFFLLLIGNTVLIVQLVKSKRRSLEMTKGSESSGHYAQVSSLTVTLILTSMAFCVLTLPTCIMDTYLDDIGFFKGDIEGSARAELTIVETVSVLMWVSNSAINFYIYILSGSKFRTETKRLLRRCLPSSRQ